MTESTRGAEFLVGYRLVRKLGSGSRAEVYLGTAGDEESASSVAIKVYRSETDVGSIAAEIDVLSRDLPAHCVRLTDLATAFDGRPVVVLERAPRGSVMEFLRARGTIARGEAVTLLAPLCLLVDQLHRGGVAHTAIGARAVYLGPQGEPVLLGFGHVATFAAEGSDAMLATVPEVVADRVGLAALANVVLRSVETDIDPRGIEDTIDWIAHASDSTRFATDLASRLFQLSEPEPLDFAAGRSTAPMAPTVRYPAEGPRVFPSLAVASKGMSDGPNRKERRASYVPLAAKEGVDEFLDGNPLARLRGRIVAQLHMVRRSVWVAAAAVAVALLIALYVLPVVDAAHTPWSRPEALDSTEGSHSGESSVAHGDDDPVVAAGTMLLARAECIAELSVLCLDSVDHSGSTAMQQDRDLIRTILDGDPGAEHPTYLPADFRLSERIGDAALIAIGPESQPGSALIIRTEAGWRLREILVS